MYGFTMARLPALMEVGSTWTKASRVLQASVVLDIKFKVGFGFMFKIASAKSMRRSSAEGSLCMRIQK